MLQISFHFISLTKKGWGCAYRTLQSMCSWIAKNRHTMDVDPDNRLTASEIPSIEEIQQTLVNINDKPESFLKSTDWLGALEVRNCIINRFHFISYAIIR